MKNVREENGQVFVAADAMKELVKKTFFGLGCSEKESRCIAERLTGANLRGHDSHGVIRVPRYAQWLGDGILVANVQPDVVLENEVLAIVDGKQGFGQSVGEYAVDVGIRKAGTHGVCIVGLKNAGHLGRIGDWAERAAAEGLVSIHMVNVRGSLIVAPFGGIDRRGSTSPFCAGIPLTTNEPPIILDMATSVVAEGKALVAFKGGKPLPNDAIVTGDGTITGDPSSLYGDTEPGRYPDPNNGTGALRAFGDHKGGGLNFLMEMMAGALTGSGCSGSLHGPQRPFANGMLSVYLDPQKFGHQNDGFVAEVKSYVEFVKSSRPTNPGGSVLIPGEKELAVLEERTQTGLPLAPQAWQDILDTAHASGMSDADLQHIL